MPALLACFFLAVVVLLLTVIIWKRPAPRHVFMLEMLSRLAEAAGPECVKNGQTSAAGAGRSA